MSVLGAWGRAVVGDFCGGVIAWPSTSLSGLSLGSPGVWSYVFQPLFVEAGETSLELRRLKLTLNYVLKLKSVPTNPACDSVFNPKCVDYFNLPTTKATPPLSIRVLPHLEAAKLAMEGIELSERLLTSPWLLDTPVK